MGGGMFYGMYILVCMSRFLLIISGKIHHKDLQTLYNVRCGVFWYVLFVYYFRLVISTSVTVCPSHLCRIVG